MINAAFLKQRAAEAGFALVGLARARALDGALFESWLANGMHASMGWLANRLAERLDPRLLLPGAKTVVSLGACFFTRAHAEPSPIALYARGRDYHLILGARLKAFSRMVLLDTPSIQLYSTVDTGPVMQKVWAREAGLGWLGKNSLLITREHGSHVLLATMIIDREADIYDEPDNQAGCGGCVECLRACPTKALAKPGSLDARLCFSYQSIEAEQEPGGFPESLRPRASLAFGCDACQSACPWNRRAHYCDDAAFSPRPIASLSLAELATLTRERFAELTNGTAIKRAKYDGLRRNALIAIGAGLSARDRTCSQDADAGKKHDSLIEIVEHLAVADQSETVREAAKWALSALRGSNAR